MHVKESGYVLVIDQASNLAGVSLWHNGDIKAHTVLRSNSSSDSYSRRLQTQVPQLTLFLNKYVPIEFKITKVVFEGMKNRLVLITIGAFLTCDRIDAKLHQRFSFVESSSWKRWAKDHGAQGITKDIKGVKALRETGFPVEAFKIESEDVADSILIYLTWRSRP